MRAQGQSPSGREITGRTVLICLVAFFGVVIGVNAVMIHAATSTFGGVETRSSYQAGINFSREKAAARRQDELHWDVSAKLLRRGGTATGLTIAVRDADGRPVSDVAMEARLIHPADARRDHNVTLRPAGAGAFAGDTAAEAGQWDLQVDILRGGERLFRSRSRVRVE